MGPRTENVIEHQPAAGIPRYGVRRLPRKHKGLTGFVCCGRFLCMLWSLSLYVAILSLRPHCTPSPTSTWYRFDLRVSMVWPLFSVCPPLLLASPFLSPTLCRLSSAGFNVAVGFFGMPQPTPCFLHLLLFSSSLSASSSTGRPVLILDFFNLFEVSEGNSGEKSQVSMLYKLTPLP